MVRKIAIKGMNLAVAAIFFVTTIAQAVPIGKQVVWIGNAKIINKNYLRTPSAVVSVAGDAIAGRLTEPSLSSANNAVKSTQLFNVNSKKTEVAGRCAFFNRILEIEKRGKIPTLIFDVDGTILNKKGNTFNTEVEMREVFVDLLINDYKIVICSGNSSVEQKYRIAKPLIDALREEGKLDKAVNLTMYANGGATKVTFDDKGKLVTKNLVDGIKDPANLGRVEKAIRKAVQEVLHTNFGYSKPDDYEKVKDALKKWLRDDKFTELSDKIKNDEEWYGRDDFGRYIKFKLSYMLGRDFAVNLEDADKIAQRVYGNNTDLMEINLPWIENRDNVQLCVKLIPNFGPKKEKGMGIGDGIDDVRGRIAAKIRDEFEKLDLGIAFNVNPTGFGSVDINIQNFNKEDAIKDLLKLPDIYAEDAIYFGNEFFIKINKDGSKKIGNDTPVFGILDLSVMSVDGKERDSEGLSNENKERLNWLGDGPAALKEVFLTLAAAKGKVESAKIELLPEAQNYIDFLGKTKLENETDPISKDDAGRFNPVILALGSPSPEAFKQAALDWKKYKKWGFERIDIIASTGRGRGYKNFVQMTLAFLGQEDIKNGTDYKQLFLKKYKDEIDKAKIQDMDTLTEEYYSIERSVNPKINQEAYVRLEENYDGNFNNRFKKTEKNNSGKLTEAKVIKFIMEMYAGEDIKGFMHLEELSNNTYDNISESMEIIKNIQKKFIENGNKKPIKIRLVVASFHRLRALLVAISICKEKTSAMNFSNAKGKYEDNRVMGYKWQINAEDSEKANLASMPEEVFFDYVKQLIGSKEDSGEIKRIKSVYNGLLLVHSTDIERAVSIDGVWSPKRVDKLHDAFEKYKNTK